MKKYLTACRLVLSARTTIPRRVIFCPWYIKPRTIEWFYLYINFSPTGDPGRFQEFFRITPEMFREICDIVRPDLQTDPPERLRVLPNQYLIVERQVVVAIRRLATGDQLLGIGELFGLSKTTASRCTWNFIKSFSRRARHFIKWPEGNALQEVKSGFSDRWNFPNCCGAVDVTHFQIELPRGENATTYYDWKHNLSVSMQAIVDCRCRFLDVFIGNPGSIQDAKVLRNSAFFRNVVYAGTKLNGEAYHTRLGARLPEYIVGDAAYPLYKWLIVPFARGFSIATDDWNHNHSSARICVERAFGKLKGTWRILSRIIVKPKLERLAPTILTCVLLHNMAALRGEEPPLAQWQDIPPHPPGYAGVHRPNNGFFEGGQEARDALFHEVMPR